MFRKTVLAIARRIRRWCRRAIMTWAREDTDSSQETTRPDVTLGFRDPLRMTALSAEGLPRDPSARLAKFVRDRDRASGTWRRTPHIPVRKLR
jgi:hypothetical protein